MECFTSTCVGVDATIAGFSAGDLVYVEKYSKGVVIKEHSSIFDSQAAMRSFLRPTRPCFMIVQLQISNLGKRVELSEWVALVLTVPTPQFAILHWLR
jgi:hypothetical protein